MKIKEHEEITAFKKIILPSIGKYSYFVKHKIEKKKNSYFFLQIPVFGNKLLNQFA